jgi:lysine decarboxylase
MGMLENEYISPIVAMTPQEAFFADKKSVPIKESKGKICSEFVMCYPPGIPILAPGEMITDEIISHILYSKEKGCFLTGTQDINVDNIQVVV